MASSWGVSWGFSWGNSWGSIAPPTPVEVGGGGGGAAVDRRRRKRPVWLDWREKERVALEKLLRGEDTSSEVQNVVRALSESEEKQAVRIVRKFSSYDGQIDQLKSLQKEIVKLETQLAQKLSSGADTLALQRAAAELQVMLEEDEEIIVFYQEVEREEAVSLLAALGARIYS